MQFKIKLFTLITVIKTQIQNKCRYSQLNFNFNRFQMFKVYNFDNNKN